MGKKKVVDIVEELVEKFIANGNDDFELVDVEFIKEGKHRYLRVFMDKLEGISIDDCQEVSKYLNQKLDEIDPIEENYFLEVSSAGIERPLKKDKDFVRFVGETIEVKLFFPIKGQKIIEGILAKVEDKSIYMRKEGESHQIEIPKDKIAAAKTVFKF